MADRLTPEARSRNMARIRSRDTKPELRLRAALFARGLRYRLCRRDLPGQPDIVFPRGRLAIQVRGCFWHQHEGCRHARTPESNRDYWIPKLRKTVARDAKNDVALRALGWGLRVVWECDMRTDEAVGNIAQDIELKLRPSGA
jgi:DNA mismatch endonuclease (patch repair protein)